MLPESWESASDSEWAETQRKVLGLFATGNSFVKQAMARALAVKLPAPVSTKEPLVAPTPTPKPATKVEPLSTKAQEYRPIISRLSTGEITREQAAKLVQAKQREEAKVKAPGWERGYHPQEAFTETLPPGPENVPTLAQRFLMPLAPELPKAIRETPVLGPTAEFVRGWTSPAGIAATGTMPLSTTARMIAGGAALGAGGRGLEEAGLPEVQVGPLNIGAGTVGEQAGMFGYAALGPTLERAALRGAKALPGAVREAMPVAREALVAGERGSVPLGPRVPEEPIPTGTTLSEDELDRALRAFKEKKIPGKPLTQEEEARELEQFLGEFLSGKKAKTPKPGWGWKKIGTTEPIVPEGAVPPKPPGEPPVPPVEVGAEPPQPIEPGRFMPRMLTVERAVAEGFEPNVARRVAESVQGVPVVSHGIRLANPSAIPADDLGRAMIGYVRSMESGQAANRLGMAQVRRVRFPFAVDANGIEVKTGQPILDVVERWPRYKAQFTVQEDQFVRTVQGLLDDAIGDAKEVGVKVTELGFAPGEHWIPRQALSKEGIQKVQGYTRGALGAKQPWQQSRFYEYVADGMAAGVDYNRDLLGTVETALNSIRRATADKMLIDIVRPRGITGVKGAPWALPADRFGKGEGYVAVAQAAPGEFPGLQGRTFLREDLDALRKTLGDREPEWLRQAGQFSAAMRVPMTAFDPGFWFIQGLGPLGKDIGNLARGRITTTWATGVERSLKAFLAPRTHADYLARFAAESPKMAEEYAQYVRGITFSEYMESVRAGGLLYRMRKVPVAGPLMQRAQGAFDAFMDVAGVETWKATSRYATTPEQLEQLGAHIRNMLGITSSKGLGISRTQAGIETTFLRFAPRYTRSVFAIVGDAAQGGLRGSEARQLLGGLAFGATAAYVGVSYALGQKPELRPWKGGRFMAAKIGENYVGLGGAYRTNLASIARIIASGIEDPKQLAQWWGPGANQNPILRAFRVGSAPLTSTAWDLLSGETFIYQQIDDPIDYLRVPERILPFGLQAYLDATGGQKERLTAAGAEWVGFRSFPVGPWEKLDTVTKELTTTWEGGPYVWADLTPGQKRQLRDQDSRVEEAWKAMQAAGLAKETEGAKATAEVEKFTLDWEPTFAQALADPQGRTNRELSDAMAEHLADRAKLSQRLYAGMKENDPRTPMQKLVDEYYALELPSLATPEQREDFFAQQDAMIAAHPELLQELHDTQVLKFQDPAVREFAEKRWQAKQVLKEYYNIPAFTRLSVEEGQKVSRILAEASDMVSLGKAASQKAAIRTIYKEGRLTAKEYGIAMNAGRRGVRNRKRALFWKANADVLEMLSEIPVE